MSGSTCLLPDAHDWNDGSALRLIVERPDDWLGAIVPTVPASTPVGYCRRCGALRLPPAMVDRLREAEVAAGVGA